MDCIDNTIERFGKSIEIEGLRFNRHNVVRLDIEQMGRLYFERIDQEMLVYLSIRSDRATNDMMVSALQLCHFRQASPLTVSAGFKLPDWIIFAIRLARQQISPAGIDAALNQLYSYAQDIYA